MTHALAPLRPVRVLVLDGDTRQALPVMRALRARGHHVTVACESRISVGWLSRWPQGRVRLPSAEAAPEAFVEALLSLLRSERFDVTLPLFDLVAHLVVEHGDAIGRLTRTPMPEREIFFQARDKANTMRACQTHGIPCPRTWFPDEQPLGDLRKELPWPVLVKPRIAHGAMGIRRVDAPDALEPTLREVESVFGPCIVQEFIPQTGMQYKAQFFRDRAGSLRAGVVFDKGRYFPVSGGTSSINRTVRRNDIVREGQRLLDAIGWTGYADLDLIEDPRDGQAKVMEINPRVTGSVKIAFEAGVDFADLLVRFALGEPLPSYDDYRVGVTMRYLPLDLLWFLYSPERFRAEPSWFRFWGRDLCWQVLSWRDPGPFLALGLSGLARLASPRVRAEKLKRIATRSS